MTDVSVAKMANAVIKQLIFQILRAAITAIISRFFFWFGVEKLPITCSGVENSSAPTPEGSDVLGFTTRSCYRLEFDF